MRYWPTLGGDGPKMVDLEQMREKYQLQDRIELLGSVRPSDVRDVRPHSCIPVLTQTLIRAGIDSRPDLPKHVVDRILRDKHHRSCLCGAVRGLDQGRGGTRDPPWGNDRVRPC